MFATFAISRVIIAHGHVVDVSPPLAIFSHAVEMALALRHIHAERAIGQTVGS